MFPINARVSRRPLGAGALILAGLTATIQPALAANPAKGSLTVSSPWLRETAPGQSAGGGFLTITNKGQAEDRLTGGTTPVAAQVQVHSMTLIGGVMRMRPVPSGLAIAAGKTVVLRPGSYHIMLMGLKRPLKPGETVPVTLAFAKAGQLKIDFKVQSITQGAGSGS